MAAPLRDQLGPYGVWRGGWQTTPAFAAELERLGYGALWIGSSPSGDLGIVDDVLDATATLTVGTSIVNIWKDDAVTVAQSFARIQERHPGRFVLGVGAGHREATSEYASPYEALAAYTDRLLEHDVPAERIVLAALGPKMLRLAGERTAGAIPYLVPPEHTRLAREILGPEPLLAPEHKAVLDSDPVSARKLGGSRVRNPYLGLVNYTSNLRRLGFTDADLSGGGSERLIDALVAHGSPDAVAEQLGAHLAAGADHVCVQLLTGEGQDPLPGYGSIARALSLQAR
ncbi:MAG TPA: LLM class F420-dependent oxidoreductase [Streptosporangiaceae bacterium]|nr:LLM class F420-dependent oxidoreductase [Streptosporangiaceae bacterium]